MTDVPIRVLVVEDEPQMLRFLRASLAAEGYRPLEARTGREGLELARTHNPDVVLLDLGLPDTDGIALLSSLREWSGRPILVLSARGREEDKVRALDLGADDYLTKPFGAGELLARIRVALRHARGAATASGEAVLRVGPIAVALDHRRVTVSGREVHLTPNEYKLLVHLMKNSGKVLTHRQLLLEVWGPAYVTQTHYLRVYMANLRQKLEEEPARPRYLVTESGVGYRLRGDDATS